MPVAPKTDRSRCGRSSDPPDRFSMADYADCLAGFVEALGLHRPHVAGLSFGGTLALEFYRRHPALPRTLTLASAYAGWAGSLPPDVVAERLESVTRDSYLTGAFEVAEARPCTRFPPRPQDGKEGSTVRVRQRASQNSLQIEWSACRDSKRPSRAGTRGHVRMFARRSHPDRRPPVQAVPADPVGPLCFGEP
jgi:pimeloyl-ACP methyl ester carboxylesterase